MSLTVSMSTATRLTKSASSTSTGMEHVDETGRSLDRSLSEVPTGCCKSYFQRVFLPEGKTSSAIQPVPRSSQTCPSMISCPRTGSDRPSSSSKHFRSLSVVDAISPAELATLMVMATGSGNDDVTTTRPKLVVIDCRTFISFNTNHVTGAFNASCGDRFSRKRLTQGRATVADLISGGPTIDCDARESYRQLATAVASDAAGVFVTYDDDTTDLGALPATHPLRLLTSSLTGCGYRTKFVTGGLQAFYAAFSTLCLKPDQAPSRPFLYSPTTPIVELDVDSAEMSCIAPFLYIGNERDAASREILSAEGISHVLNVTSHVPQHFDDDDTMTYMRVQASDSCCQNLKQYFDEVVAFIESARCSGGRVLVHCQAGVSRSPTIVVAYLMARYGRPLMETFLFVKQKREIVAPNFNFMGQLLDFEQRCRRGDLSAVLDDTVPPSPLFPDEEPV